MLWLSASCNVSENLDGLFRDCIFESQSPGWEQKSDLCPGEHDYLLASPLLLVTRSCPASTAAQERCSSRLLLRLLWQGNRPWPLAEQRLVPHTMLRAPSAPTLAMAGERGAAGEPESLKPTLHDKASTGGWRSGVPVGDHLQNAFQSAPPVKFIS